MKVDAATARRFSSCLVRLHQAGSERALFSAIATALTRLFPSLTRSEKEARRQALLAAPAKLDGGATARRDKFLMELLAEHVAQRRALLLESTPGGAPGRRARFAPSPLTQREREVLERVALGETDAAIARFLEISPRTVSKHVENLLAKLGVETRTAAVAAVFANDPWRRSRSPLPSDPSHP